MINIDTVYQKVLTLANKEQRGYITPQEFNLLANKAQMDIYENIFHDLKTAKHKQFSNEEAGYDEVSMLEEKLHPFRVDSGNMAVQANTQGVFIPINDLDPPLYRLDSVLLLGVAGALINSPILITEVTQSEFRKMIRNPLTAPRDDRPIFYRLTNTTGEVIRPVGNGFTSDGELVWGFVSGTNFSIDYWRIPEDPKWGYIVINSKQLYDSSNSTNFRLHATDEEPLVSRILELAGITLGKQELQQSMMVDKQNTEKIQNN